jgi:glycosyltransferase involved in cell wall biosynthesis
MRIVQITPGSGDSFYCENCLRDTALVRAMRNLGHDVLMVPMYLPLQSDRTESLSNAPIFFGGINVYLQQKSTLFRRTPQWIARLLDSPRLLRWVGRRAKMTSAKDLGEMTISMLLGEEGRQTRELERLIEWLGSQDNRPDVVCLSNALLAGLARAVKARLGVPIVCLLQDEDGFLDGLPPPYAKQAWEVVAERCSDVDAFISVSKYYAGVMQHRLGLDPDKVYVVYMGISLDEYRSAEAGSGVPEVPAIGYLSRMCPDKGLDTLVDAFVILKKDERLKNAKLRIAGGSSGDDGSFVNRIRRQLSSCGLVNDVEFLPDFGRDAKLAFLQTLSVLSVPEKKPVACGLYVLESLAAGVPVVQPASGVFIDLLEVTSGGVLCKPNSAEALAAALKPLLLNPNYARQLGRQGREAVFEKFNIEQTAKELVRIYDATVQQFHRG